MDSQNDQNSEDEQAVVIHSKNFKTRGAKIRAPSCGSSGSQPRVKAVSVSSTKDGTGSGQLSLTSGAPRRYDSIEHARQSKIEKYLNNANDQKYLESQQQQIHQMRQKKVAGKNDS